MNIPFRKAINRITRKTSEAKALPAFKKFIARDVKNVFRAQHFAPDADAEEKAVLNYIAKMRREGFAPESVEGLAKQYAALPRQAPRKKSLQAAEREKMGKTPR